MNKIYVITGQTATGKTSNAIELAKLVNGELINCDSRQIYKKLDIVTGKDLENTNKEFHLVKKKGSFDLGYYELLSIPIWLYDVVEPHVSFSPFDYRTCAIEIISEILSKNKTPIIVGGTYFYLKNLLYATIETLVEPNENLRRELNEKTIPELQHILIKLDKNLFNSLNNSEKNNTHRLIRKIEILKQEKNTKNHQQSLAELFPEIKIELEGYYYEFREDLLKAITTRVEKRIQQGAINETKLLLDTYSELDPGLRTIGYKQIIDFLKGSTSIEEMKNEWIIKEMQYAKRQMTFMKKDQNIKWKKSSDKKV